MLSDIKRLKDAVQEIVDKGVTSVEQIHKSIAEIPFKHLEQTAPPRVKPYVEPVKNAQDAIVGAVYDVIRKVNRQVGALADEVLQKVGKAGEGQQTNSSA
ncbi:MAG: hypothetical protein AB1640_08035 [bacterium]